jgi:tRNA-dihydrouridine synthase 4
MVGYTNCDGVMVAQGLLQNPGMFAGYENTPKQAVKTFVKNSIGYGDSNLFIFHHHLMYMLESQMSASEKKHFNQLGSIPTIIDYLEECYDMDFS